MKLPGFFLIQAAVGLAILGVVSTIGVSKLTQYLKFQQIQKTELAKEKIFYALAGYVLQHKRLPCPAGKEGTERLKCPSAELAQGIVPYKDLGLIDPQDAKDGYGNYFTYAVDPALTEACTTLMAEKAAPVNTVLKDKQEEGDGLEDLDAILEDSPTKVETELSGKAFCQIAERQLKVSLKKEDGSFEKAKAGAVILISHGHEGRGAPFGGVSCTGEEECRNTNRTDLDFVSAPMSKKKGEEFSHQVFFLTRNNLMARYGRYPCYVGNN